jgi:hypothetical protein
MGRSKVKVTISKKKIINERSIIAALRPIPLATQLMHMLYAESIRRVPIFSKLNDEIIVKICMSLHSIPATKWDPVVVQGRVASEMYVVNKGKLEVWANSKTVRMRARIAVDEAIAWASVHELSSEGLSSVMSEIKSLEQAV